jgi:hypothetical protein
MTQAKGKVPVVTLQKSDKDSAKEFKGTTSKNPAKDSGSRHVSKTLDMPPSRGAQKGPTLRGKK